MRLADVGGDDNKLPGEGKIRELHRPFGCLGMGMASDGRPGCELHGKCDLRLSGSSLNVGIQSDFCG